MNAARAGLSSQVAAVTSIKERSTSAGSKRTGSAGTTSTLQFPSPLEQPGVGPPGGHGHHLSARLPPLTHSGHASLPAHAATLPLPRRHGAWSAPPEALHMLLQHPTMLSGPAPAVHPYQPRRKPPSAFMRNNPTRQHLELQQLQHQQQQQGLHSGARPFLAAAGGHFDVDGAAAAAAAAGYDSLSYGLRSYGQSADELVAAAAAAVAAQLKGQQGAQEQGQQGSGDDAVAPGDGLAGGAAAVDAMAAAAPPPYSATPPWGVSSVSDLEALDSILDQLVVVDTRMRKALLKGPLISFETVVPEHIMNGQRGGAAAQRGPGEEERDHTFLTSVRGIAEEGGVPAEGDEAAALAAEEAAARAAAEPPPPPEQDTAEAAASAAAAAAEAAAAQARAQYAAQEEPDPLATSLFKAAIPNPGMHPTFTRAYLASKLSTKPQHLPPQPPATAEYLLRSRPPPFIAAPSYDQLCSQIRDVQRQYTCGTAARPAAAAGSAGAAAPAGLAGALFPASPAAGPSTANQYISGLDGPMLDEVVAQQDLPISLERVRPTFVALRQKPLRAASPKRRSASMGRLGAVELEVAVGSMGGGGVNGHRL